MKSNSQIKYSEKSYETEPKPTNFSHNYQSNQPPKKTSNASNPLLNIVTSNSLSNLDQVSSLKSRSFIYKDSPSSIQTPYVRKKKFFNYLKKASPITAEVTPSNKNNLNQSRSFTTFTFPQNQNTVSYKYLNKELHSNEKKNLRKSTSITKVIKPINTSIISKYCNKYSGADKLSKSISSSKANVAKPRALNHNTTSNLTYTQYSPKSSFSKLSSFTYLKQKPSSSTNQAPMKNYISKILEVNKNSDLSTSYSNTTLSNFQSGQYDMPAKQLQVSSFMPINNSNVLNISEFPTINQSSHLKKYSKMVKNTKIPESLKTKLIKKKQMNNYNIINQSSPPEPVKNILLQSSTYQSSLFSYRV
jgi:hypothetical protein